MGQKSTSWPSVFTARTLKPMLEWEGRGRKSIQWDGGCKSETSSCAMVCAARITTHLQKNREKITTVPQKQRRKVWTKLKNGLFGWRIVRGTVMNNKNSATPTTQQNTHSTNYEQQCVRWVPENIFISNTWKNISGDKKGFSKRKIEVGIADQTGGDRNLRWKPDLTQDLDTDLVRPNKQAT